MKWAYHLVSSNQVDAEGYIAIRGINSVPNHDYIIKQEIYHNAVNNTDKGGFEKAEQQKLACWRQGRPVQFW